MTSHIQTALEPLMRASLHMDMLGLGLTSFQALFECPAEFPYPTEPLQDPSRRILHVLVPNLKADVFPSLNPALIASLQTCINHQALYSTHAGFPCQTSFVPLNTLQSVWLAIAHALDLIENPSDGTLVLKTLGNLLHEAYTSTTRALSFSEPSYIHDFEVRCSVFFLKQHTEFATLASVGSPPVVSPEPIFNELFSATSPFPRGISSLLFNSPWPQTIQSSATIVPQLPPPLDGYHHPIPATALLPTAPIQLATSLCQFPSPYKALHNLSYTLRSQFTICTLSAATEAARLSLFGATVGNR